MSDAEKTRLTGRTRASSERTVARMDGESDARVRPDLTRRWYKVREVAEILGIRYQAVLDLIRAGHLKTVDVPGMTHYRIDIDELEDFIASASARERKIDPKLDPNASKNIGKVQEISRRSRGVKNGEFVIKPNWYKSLAR